MSDVCTTQYGIGSHYSFRSALSFLATHPPGARPDRAGKFINKRTISSSKGVPQNFSARLGIAIRHVIYCCKNRLSIARPAFEVSAPHHDTYTTYCPLYMCVLK